LYQHLLRSARASGERLRSAAGRRTVGILLALLVELLLGLLLLTLAPSVTKREDSTVTVVSLTPDAEPAPEAEPQPEAAAPDPRPARETPPPVPPPPIPPPPVPAPPPLIPLTRDELRPLDNPPPRPSAPRPIQGPPAPRGASASGDTPQVGTAPNGEPLYAASWYREPYPEELRGFLSAARGPGWGLIACRTVPDYRVEDCVAIGEYPEGSNIARSVLAAAWQFRVRPPRLGGRDKVGEWVRIRIDYELRRER